MNLKKLGTRREFIKIATMIAAVFTTTFSWETLLHGKTDTKTKQQSKTKSKAKAKDKPKEEKKQPAPIVWDEEWDIIIVGSGFAGSTALCEATDGGAKALMIDKMATLGGNSAISSGAFAVVNSISQMKRGIEDSVRLCVSDMMASGGEINDPDLVKLTAEHSNQTLDFIEKRGVVYRDQLSQPEGHSVPRTISAAKGSGSEITIPLQRYATKRGAEIRTQTILDDIIFDGNGATVGIKVRENYSFNHVRKNEERNTTGDTKYYKAKAGIILATGGFAYDSEFATRYDSHIPKTIGSTNHDGANAQTIKVMMQNDLDTLHLKYIEMIPYGSPDEVGYNIASLFAPTAYKYGVAINIRNGKRFMNEQGKNNERSEAICKVWKDKKGRDSYPILIWDTVAMTSISQDDIKRGIDSEVIRQFGTTDEVARFHRVSQKELKSSLEQYREYVKTGKDNEFGRTIVKFKGSDVDLSKPPYYTMRLAPKLHHTMGGIRIDKECRAISKKNQEPIKNLFAAGEAVGGTHGENRLESCSATECLVFGRVAAKTALKNLKQS